jgi:thiol-disulfide isomerase/thioredoxin
MVLAGESKPIDLSAYKGKVVLVDFWASWCLPCKESFPWLNKIKNKTEFKDLVIIGINVDENIQDAKRFLEQQPAEFSIIYDSSGSHAEYYNVLGMPTTLIFDKQGELISQHIGFKENKVKEYEQNIYQALNNNHVIQDSK